jgi:dolichol-phosphate hexosyltransferase
VPDPRVTVLRHPVNRGKGSAIRTGVRATIGSHLVVLDADLEYDPANTLDLLAPVLAGRTEVIFGNRHFRTTPRTRCGTWWATRS